MVAFLAGMGAALWLGIQMGISPCPMATNIAAISFIGRRVGNTSYVLLAGLLYAVGRTLAYVVLALLLLSSLLAKTDLSVFLDKYVTQLLGPILIIVAMFLLDMIRLNFSGPGVSEKMQKRVEAMGIWGALLMGVLFALSFCPISAVLFFGGLIPLALECRSSILLPSLFGIGTALPVILFAVLIAFSAQAVGKAYDKLTQIEWWTRRIAGVVFLVIGIHFSLKYMFQITPFWDPWIQAIMEIFQRN